MQISHMTDVVQTPALCRLAQCIRQRREQWQPGEEAPDLERFEQELHAHVMAFECEMLADERRRYDVSAAEVLVDGVPYQRRLASSETYVSAAGPVTVTRHLYRPAGRSTKSICPLEVRAGIVGGLWTPRAARQGMCVLAHLTPREGATLFAESGGMQPSASTLDRWPKTLAVRWAAHRERWEAAFRASETVAADATVIAISLDGVMNPMAASALQETDEPAAPAPMASAPSRPRH